MPNMMNKTDGINNFCIFIIDICYSSKYTLLGVTIMPCSVEENSSY